ncbi:hypothetical protein [Gephyromycinifex aptenodytis]|uniref:hypothetical protein n=1 Tax=Gephyromycinifex aptenodytis TaxID=2716227 RepID=UPI00144854E2|nr:hypothetical protein [Gephyromycinifex aptenodytis]
MSQPFEQAGATAATGNPVNPTGPGSTGAKHDENSTKDVAKDRAAGVADDAKQNAAEVAGTAKEGAAQVADSAKRSATEVAGTAKAEAQQVLDEAGQHAAALFSQAREEMSTQFGTQQSRLTETLRTLSSDLSSMAQGEKPAPGIASDLAHQASGQLHSYSQWLDERGPAELLEEVKRFARRKPGTFLAVAAVTGLVAGRLTRSIADDARSDDEPNYSGTEYTRMQRPAAGYDATHVQPAYTEPGYVQPAYAGQDGVVDTTGVDSAARGQSSPQYGGAGDYPGTAGNEGRR